ncbi:hypothetical protein ScPMuIL_014252 [Solemya velum]
MKIDFSPLLRHCLHYQAHESQNEIEHVSFTGCSESSSERICHFWQSGRKGMMDFLSGRRGVERCRSISSHHVHLCRGNGLGFISNCGDEQTFYHCFIIDHLREHKGNILFDDGHGPLRTEAAYSVNYRVSRNFITTFRTTPGLSCAVLHRSCGFVLALFCPPCVWQLVHTAQQSGVIRDNALQHRVQKTDELINRCLSTAHLCSISVNKEQVAGVDPPFVIGDAPPPFVIGDARLRVNSLTWQSYLASTCTHHTHRRLTITFGVLAY